MFYPLVGYYSGEAPQKTGITVFREKHVTVLSTVDAFITSLPWGRGNWRNVLVHRREHGGRAYIRLHTWNRHRTKLVWYPTRRSFVIPIENAKALADALRKAAAGWPDEKPDWLVAREEGEAGETRS